MDALSSQRENADRKTEELQLQLDALNEEVSEKKREEVNQQEEKQLLVDQVQQLSEAVQNLKKKDQDIVRLENELQLSQEEKLQLVEQLTSLNEELVLLKDAYDQLQAAAVPIAENEAIKETVSVLGSSVNFTTGSASMDLTLESEAVTPLQEEIPVVQQSVPLQTEPSSVHPSEPAAGHDDLHKTRMELKEIQAELTKAKALNEKLKAKVRVFMKKERAKSESVRDVESSDMKAEIDKARQEKINLEKTSLELREELVEIVREKDGTIGDLKQKIRQLLNEKSRNEVLVERYEKLLAERDEEIKRIAANADVEAQGLRDRCQHVLEDKEFLVKKIQQEKLEYVQELENTKDGYEKVLSDKDEEIGNFKRELENCNIETEELKGRLRQTQESFDELNKLKVDFDHIISGLRGDLQQALEEKAVADQLAHEFRVQLERMKSSYAQGDIAAGVEDVGRNQLVSSPHYLQEIAEPIAERVDAAQEEEDGERISGATEPIMAGRPDLQTLTNTREGEDVSEERPSFAERTLETSDYVVSLQNELKQASDLNNKLKEALKKKRSKPRSKSSGEHEMSNETIAELEGIRAAKVESDKQMAHLRLELDNFVQEKERIVAGFKSKMEKLADEKERANSLIEDYEKQLLTKDTAVRDLKVKFDLLSSENDVLKSDVENLPELKLELQLTVQENAELENDLRYNKSLVKENTDRVSELKRELESREEKHLKEIEEIKERHDQVLIAKQKETDEAILELRQINTELQDNLQSVSDNRDATERELIGTRAKLEQVVQDSYPVIEEKSQKIQELLSQMEENRINADNIIVQLERSESTLQEQVQELELSGTELKKQLEETRAENQKQRLRFQRSVEEKETELREEKEGLQQQMQQLEAKFEELLSQSQASISKLEEELAHANMELVSFNEKLQTADGEKQDIEKLRNNFDHITSGLRGDLQQAINARAAAEELAHEFQVQLEKMRKSNPTTANEVDEISPAQENKMSEMLEATQREEANLRAALEATLIERDALQNRLRDFELVLSTKSEKEALSSDDGNSNVNEDNVQKVVEEVILQSSEDNQVSSLPTSETEVEIENLKNELQRVKNVNEKLKAKLRTMMKKRRVKSDSGDEDSSVRNELQTELEKIRQEKLEREKTCQELRLELDTFVREKESITNELRRRIDELSAKIEQSNTLIEDLEAQVKQKDGQLLELMMDVRVVENDNDQAWQNVETLRYENADLLAEKEDLISQSKEHEKDSSELKVYYESLVEEYKSLLDKKDRSIAHLENQLDEVTEKYKTELRATRDQHEGIILQIQSHADNLEKERLLASKETEQLKSQLTDFKNEREDIGKLKDNFDHIVSNLREDLQRALEGKAAADEIAHEFQVQLKHLEKVSGNSGTQFENVAVDTSDIETREEELEEKLDAVQTEAANMRKALDFYKEDKQRLENEVANLERELHERETMKVNIGKEEEDGIQGSTFYETSSESPEESVVCESEALLGSAPPQIISADYENEELQKVRDDWNKMQNELDKVKAVNERLKIKLKTLMRKRKGGKVETSEEENREDLHTELAKVRKEKLETERAAQQLRIDLDEIVREKERRVVEHKTRMQQVLTEKEEVNNLLETKEKLLLERDAAVSSLVEQIQSLGDKLHEVEQSLAQAMSENRNLNTVLEQLQLQKVKAERELHAATGELERLLEGDRPILAEKEQRISNLEGELSDLKEAFDIEMRTLKDRYDVVVSEQQKHINNLESTLGSLNTEKKQLESRVKAFEDGIEDINKLRTNFDHIISGLREDLHGALEGKAAAEEIANELQMKFRRFEKSSLSSELKVEDVCIGTEDMESRVLSDNEAEIEELRTAVAQFREEKYDLEEQVLALDKVVQDGKGNSANEVVRQCFLKLETRSF